MQHKKVTRLEVIENGKGRQFVKYDFEGAEVSLQDDGTTMKIFINYPQ